MDNRKMYCMWSRGLRNAEVIVGNSITDIRSNIENLDDAVLVKVKSSGDMEYPFAVGNLKFRYCYLIKRKVTKAVYHYKCPFCGKMHIAAKKSQWGNVKCPHCKVVASLNKWEEVCE